MNFEKRFVNKYYPDFENVKDFLYYTVKQYSDKNAFILKEKIDKDITYKYITYSNFLDEVNNLGTAFYNRSLQEKRIAVIGKNSYEWALTFISTLVGNMVIVPLDKDLTEVELENSLNRVNVDAIIFDSKVKDKIISLRDSEKINIKYYIYSSNDEKIENTEYIYDLVEEGKESRENGDHSYENVKIDSYKCSELCFTSGTSAASKIVMLSQRNLAFDVSGLNVQENLNSNDVNLAFLPMHHTFGSTGLLFIMSYGAATAFPDGLRYIQSNMKEYGVSVFIGVPLLLEAIYKRIEKEVEKQHKEKLVKFLRKATNICRPLKRLVFKSIIDNLGGKLRMVVSGAAALDKDIWEAFNELGITIVQGYGLTEASPVVSGENYKYYKKGSIGFPLRGIEVKVLEKNEFGIGQIAVKGDNVMLGYYENEEANKKTFTEDGWLLTGDLGYVDQKGYIFVCGREKNVIVLKNGKNVYPEEIEGLVNKIPEVKESMVFALPKAENDTEDSILSIEVQYDIEYIEQKYPNIDFSKIDEIIWNKIKEVNVSLPSYKSIKKLITTKDDFIKTTTAKIKRYEELAKIKMNLQK